MSESETNSDSAAKSSRSGLLLLLLLAGGGVVAGAIYLANPGDGNGSGPGGSGDSELLQLTRTALAATENLQTEEADEAWSKIFADTPEDDAVALNRCLNRVLRIDLLADQAMNSSLEETEQMAARQKLPSAIDAARSAIDQYDQVADDAVLGLWLRSRIDLRQAALLPDSMTRPLQKEVYQTLSKAILGEAGKSPRSIALAGPLSDVLNVLEDPIDGLPPDLLKSASETLAALSDQHPNNLFLATNAARLNIAVQNERAGEFVLRTRKLAKAVEPSIARDTAAVRLTPEELVGKITEGIAAGDWDEASRHMQWWFNVLNKTEIIKTDRRLASPHPLDRLSFDSLRRLSAGAVQSSPLGQGDAAFEFEPVTIDQVDDIKWIKPIDFDLDLDDDLVAVSSDGVVTLLRNDGSDGWARDAELPLNVRPLGVVVADLFMVDSSDTERVKKAGVSAEDRENSPLDFSAAYRHDTFPGLLIYGDSGVRIIGVDGRESTSMNDRLSMVDADKSGLAGVTGVTAATVGDLEGDGDLDLVLATKSEGVRLFVNRGNRSFFEATHHEGGFDPGDPVVAMTIVDLDRDLDLDVVTVHGSGAVGVLENLLHLQFRGRMLDEIPTVKSARFIAVEDADANVSWDLIVGGEEESVIVFSQTSDAGVWTVDKTETLKLPLLQGAIADFDNDSWSDLLRVGSGDCPSVCRIGPWGVSEPEDVTSLAPREIVDQAPINGPFYAANLNSDGKVDLVCVQDGTPRAMLNRTQTDGHFLGVRFKGIADNAANSGRVNHFGIGSVLELRFGPHYRAKIITTPETHFGLSGFEQAGSIRVILPNGMSQTIRNPAIDTVVEEEQKLKGSCPYLYAWDGEKFAFMTDCLWAAPLGLQVARGVVAKDRPWEYLKVDGSRVRPRDGRYDFRMTEELWEVAYVDKLAMRAVDRPADVEIWTNEKVGPGDVATPTIFAFRRRDVHGLENAVDTLGRDVTRQLLERDRDFVQGFDRRMRQGLCPPHWIDLDFGNATEGKLDEPATSCYLVLTGWILPTDTSLNIQIDQNPELPPIEFPSVWVPDDSQADGWRKAIPFMGFPGGKTKTIVVDVTNILRAEDPRLRIRTSAQIYWDSAQLAIQDRPAEFNVQELELLSAEVAYHGFSRRIEGGPRQPESYDYQQPNLSAIWPPLAGTLTRFGECAALLRHWDDSMAVIGSGDEIRFSFQVPPSSPPPGWKRDFVLHCVGWDKDADLNTLAGQRTGPLPFKEMGEYPPTSDQWDAEERVGRANQRHLQRRQSFRSFWYRGEIAPPSRFLPRQN